jgi:hypothetical protein
MNYCNTSLIDGGACVMVKCHASKNEKLKPNFCYRPSFEKATDLYINNSYTKTIVHPFSKQTAWGQENESHKIIPKFTFLSMITINSTVKRIMIKISHDSWIILLHTHG